MKNNTLRIAFILFLVIINIGCDQVTKDVARKNVEYNEYIDVINNNLIITKVENTGAFLGLGDSLPPVFWYILMLALPAIILFSLLGYILYRNEFNVMSIIGFSCMVGGGIGNMIDRFLYHSVTDFLFIDIGIAHTGVFNMADVSVTLGVSIILIQYFIQMRNEKKEIKEELA